MNPRPRWRCLHQTDLMYELKDTMFSRKDGSVAQHLGQNATNRPDVNGLGVTLGIQHDLGGTVPSRCYVFRQETCVVVAGVSYPCKSKVADLRANYKNCMYY